MDSFYVNNKRRFSTTFKVVSTSAFGDPSSITAYVHLPSGAVTEYVYGVTTDVEKDSVGHYHLDVIPTLTGELIVGFKGAGTIDTYTEQTVYVLPARATT